MNSKVSIAKALKLAEGEELMDFVNKVYEAIGMQRQDVGGSTFLRGIFDGFVITRDSENGKFFKSKMTRDKEGIVKLGPPVEVRQAFIPVGADVSKSADGANDVTNVDGESFDVDFVEIEKAASLFAGVV